MVRSAARGTNAYSIVIGQRDFRYGRSQRRIAFGASAPRTSFLRPRAASSAVFFRDRDAMDPIFTESSRHQIGSFTRQVTYE